MSLSCCNLVAIAGIHFKTTDEERSVHLIVSRAGFK